MSIIAVSLAKRPDLAGRIGELESESFPEYINAEPTWEECFPRILDTQAHLQIFIIDDEADELMAMVCHCQLDWDGDPATLPGYNELLRATLETDSENQPSMLVGIMGIVPEKHRGKKVPELFHAATQRLLKDENFEYYTSPVRPTLKQLYPNFSIEEYLNWKTDDGRPFDPWIRTNEGLGTDYLCIAHDSISVSASVEQWQEWCGMKFPVSGEYVIPGGHQLLRIDLESDIGCYGEDHVWYSYHVMDIDD
jgi:hypothetical protein